MHTDFPLQGHLTRVTVCLGQLWIECTEIELQDVGGRGLQTLFNHKEAEQFLSGALNLKTVFYTLCRQLGSPHQYVSALAYPLHLHLKVMPCSKAG